HDTTNSTTDTEIAISGLSEHTHPVSLLHASVSEVESGTQKNVENAAYIRPVKQPRVVIVGAGFGGLRAARALRNEPVQVTVIDRQNHHLFQPLLYWVATAGLSPADICSPIRGILESQKNAEVFMEEVTGVDVQEQHVLMGDRSVPYDYLVLTTGAHDNYFGHPEWEHNAPGLKTIVDAISIRRKILLAFEAAEIETDAEKVKALLTFVLVGAGPTGVEMAGAIAELAHKALVKDFRHIDTLKTRIILIEAAPRILGTFPESLALKTQKKLISMGVEVRTGTPVTELDEHGVVLDGERINAATIIWGAGVSASSAGKWLGAEVDRAGRVKVLSDLSVPGHPNVFVVGDTASFMQNGKPLPGVAQVAMQGGQYVASVISHRVRGKELNKPFYYRDKGNLATVGRSYAIVDINNIHLSGFFAWLMWLAVHIYFLVGFRNRLVAIFQWAWTYFTYDRGARLITFENEHEP
ncbi:MAG TPA: NAD(P)/FAD-dependent oxidoreductase, partial [Ktedonobacteraceae bacterium]|nr:NAD(P)/FAD-dependent oxidoreductase [Ktedonobacteraceae bacterium]